jgi:hypothetical protein
VGDSGLKAEMSEKPESFDAFLSRWINECIQKLGEVDPVDREDIVEKKAAELVARSEISPGFTESLMKWRSPMEASKNMCVISIRWLMPGVLRHARLRMTEQTIEAGSA